MRAKIILHCISGFGDQYANILTGYKACKDFTNFGYEVEILWINKNLYFSPDLPLDYLYDFSLFKKMNIKINYIHNESEISDGFLYLNTGQNAIKIFVDKIIDEINEYELPVFDYFGFRRNSYSSFCPEKLPDFDYQFINEEVLEIGNKFIEKKSKIKSVHFRCDDLFILSDYDIVLEDVFYNSMINRVYEFIEMNNNQDIMICSNNKSLVKHITKNFKNTFYNTFDSDLDLHYSYNKNYEEMININHARQIVAEMTLFSRCDNIFTVSKSLSNFLTYGVAHNHYHKDWDTKIKNLITN
jgi:hypothetical protein